MKKLFIKLIMPLFREIHFGCIFHEGKIHIVGRIAHIVVIDVSIPLVQDQNFEKTFLIGEKQNEV